MRCTSLDLSCDYIPFLIEERFKGYCVTDPGADCVALHLQVRRFFSTQVRIDLTLASDIMLLPQIFTVKVALLKLAHYLDNGGHVGSTKSKCTTAEGVFHVEYK